eukprot:763366-Hanusia_phi.AAC.5
MEAFLARHFERKAMAEANLIVRQKSMRNILADEKKVAEAAACHNRSERRFLFASAKRMKDVPEYDKNTTVLRSNSGVLDLNQIVDSNNLERQRQTGEKGFRFLDYNNLEVLETVLQERDDILDNIRHHRDVKNVPGRGAEEKEDVIVMIASPTSRTRRKKESVRCDLLDNGKWTAGELKNGSTQSYRFVLKAESLEDGPPALRIEVIGAKKRAKMGREIGRRTERLCLKLQRAGQTELDDPDIVVSTYEIPKQNSFQAASGNFDREANMIRRLAIFDASESSAVADSAMFKPDPERHLVDDELQTFFVHCRCLPSSLKKVFIVLDLYGFSSVANLPSRCLIVSLLPVAQPCCLTWNVLAYQGIKSFISSANGRRVRPENAAAAAAAGGEQERKRRRIVLLTSRVRLHLEEECRGVSTCARLVLRLLFHPPTSSALEQPRALQRQTGGDTSGGGNGRGGCRREDGNCAGAADQTEAELIAAAQDVSGDVGSQQHGEDEKGRSGHVKEAERREGGGCKCARTSELALQSEEEEEEEGRAKEEGVGGMEGEEGTKDVAQNVLSESRNVNDESVQSDRQGALRKMQEAFRHVDKTT